MNKKLYLSGLVLVLMLATMLLSSSLHAQEQLAPDGVERTAYFAPFPHTIALDGDFADWAGVPTVIVPQGGDVTAGYPAITFAAAADGEFLYLMGDVVDDNIISGAHGTDYWNEDSIEFYLNGTGDLTLTSYEAGVAQMTIPALNTTLEIADAIVGGTQGDTVNAQVKAVATDTGYAVEIAVPLENEVWSITPSHGGIIGFQVHLNGASTDARDTKLIWSAFDTADLSYQNPSLFGYLVFYEIGQTEVPDVDAAVVAMSAPAEGEGATEVPSEVSYNSPYLNPHLSTEERVENLLSLMTLEEKIGQMTLVEKNSINPTHIATMSIGGLLSGGGGYPRPNTAEAWADMVNEFQEYALASRLGIPMIYGVDAVHGHGNLQGATIFPHNIGLGATNNPELVEQVCQATAAEMIATGIYWNYAPVVAVVQDVRWGRTYEAYGETTDLVSALGTACLHGLQGDGLGAPGTVLATPKHYIGDGATTFGSSVTGTYLIDQGVMEVDEEVIREVYLPPYQAAIDAGAMSIMISFSSWNETKMHAQAYLINDVLKGEMGFEGFIVSDWGGIDQISTDYYEAVVTSINAGVDMNMVPYNYTLFIDTMLAAVESGDIPMERIDDAVRRILTTKYEMGLFEWGFSQPSYLETVGSDEHRALAAEAVSQSLVLLKNENAALPLSADAPLIFVSGEGGDDIGMQSGGWTIEWQGLTGDIQPGTTIVEALRAETSEDRVFFDRLGRFRTAVDAAGNPLTADIGIVVIGEKPYAEGVGDRETLALEEIDINLVNRMRERASKVIVILLSGRPVLIEEPLAASDAFVAAWLPGTEGQGITDVLFGEKPFTGTLSYTWLDADGGELFPVGFGLTYAE